MSSQTIAIRLIDTVESLNPCIADLIMVNPTASNNRAIKAPELVTPKMDSIAVDMEGVPLNRHGKVSIVQMRRTGSDVVWLLDITTCGQALFDHTHPGNGWSIRKILQSKDIKKLFYDVRRDADALYNIYNIDVACILDLQLLDLAVTLSEKKYGAAKRLTGLGQAISKLLPPSAEWKEIKEEGTELFSPAKGGSYEVFEERPMDRRLLLYCAHDVLFLHDLEAALSVRLTEDRDMWAYRVVKAGRVRLREGKAPVMAPEGKHRALAPRI